MVEQSIKAGDVICSPTKKRITNGKAINCPDLAATQASKLPSLIMIHAAFLGRRKTGQ